MRTTLGRNSEKWLVEFCFTYCSIKLCNNYQKVLQMFKEAHNDSKCEVNVVLTFDGSWGMSK